MATPLYEGTYLNAKTSKFGTFSSILSFLDKFPLQKNYIFQFVDRTWHSSIGLSFFSTQSIVNSYSSPNP